MGFYFEMHPRPGTDESPLEYSESNPPVVFWVLFLFAGFALTCMGLAAQHLLLDLASQGATIDKIIVGGIYGFLPLYFLAGLKIGALRKFASLDKEELRLGYRLGGKEVWSRSITKSSIESFELLNRKPSPNIAPVQHEDSQYYIRGHWRLMAKLQTGKYVTVDKHTEKEALTPFFADCSSWLHSS